MTSSDREYVAHILHKGLIGSPCLELGVGYGGGTSKTLLRAAGVAYVGTDLTAAKDVDVAIDFEADSADVAAAARPFGPFGSALVLNVLEHTFEPIRVLDNVFRILRRGGTCIAVTPAIWPLHSYPRDYWRLNPDFYEEYCARRGHVLLGETFQYVGTKRVLKRNCLGEHVFPKPGFGAHRFYSRFIHRLFNTCGRAMFFPSHVAVGVVVRKSCQMT